MQKYKIKYIVLSLLFIAAIFFPFINKGLKIIVEKQNPNFNYSPNPELKYGELNTFPAAYEKYYNQNYGLRTLLISSNTYFKGKILGVSPDESKVIIGKDNWLFLAGQALDNYRGINLFSERGLDSIRNIIHGRAEWLHHRGATFYFVLVPNKHCIYSEYLPSNIIKINQLSVIDQVTKLFEGDSLVHIIDLRKPLLEAKKAHTLYYKKDNHWNDYGAYYGYAAIIKEINKKFPSVKCTPLNDFVEDSSVELTGGGDALQINMEKWIFENKISLKPKGTRAISGEKKNYKWPSGFIYTSDFEMQKVVNNDSLPTALIIRDSFMDYMLPFLEENFSKSTFLFDAWEYKANKPIIESEKPQIVILEVIEDLLKHIVLHDAKDEAYKTLGTDNKKIVLKASNGNYITLTPDLKLYANEPDINHATLFELHDIGSGKTSIKADNKKYLCAELDSDKNLRANRDNVGDWESFEISWKNQSQINIKAKNEKFVCADQTIGAVLIANRDSPGDWETFTVQVK